MTGVDTRSVTAIFKTSLHPNGEIDKYIVSRNQNQKHSHIIFQWHFE